MGLARYRQKRHFGRTPEPRGGIQPRRRAGQLRYFIQRHAATRLHYDFRLELDGVLKSWAVPKGPSLDPSEKRLAVHVEDHPLEYGTFEGTIPKGEYGAGQVILWDQGVWVPLEDPREGYSKGHLSFRLDGKKLAGRWNLVRMKPDDERGGKENWLLIKVKDESARAPGDLVEERPESVKSPEAPIPPAERPAVQLATLSDRIPAGDEWLHEIKLDGYRILAHLEGGKVRLHTRNGLEWTSRLAPVAAALEALPARQAIVDGEAVVLDEDGTSSFAALQNALSEGALQRIAFYAFDLLHLDGRDLRPLPLIDRKALLADLLKGRDPSGPVRYTDHVVGRGRQFYRRACEFALEGVVSKRKDRPHRPGRGTDWIKVKCGKRQEFVIAGFTGPEGGREGFGALLLGYHDPDGHLVYAGRVGTGFGDVLLKSLRRRLETLERKDSPFRDPLPRREARGVHWVEPRLVAEARFGNWTRDGRLRHPVFLGLREDKRPEEIVREIAHPPLQEGDKGSVHQRPSLLRKNSPVEVAGVRLTHPDRVLYPDQGITKLALAEFYEEIAGWILPHLRGRPLALLRCPEGEGRACFFQKHRTTSMPETLRPVEIAEGAGTGRKTYVYIDDVAGLVSLVQFGVLEIHPWGSRVDDLERPDRCIFDLDPGPGVAWERVVEAARLLREMLDRRGLKSFLKTTGGKGLHVMVPLRGRQTWPELKAFSKSIADELEREAPDRYTARLPKARREGRIFIDYLRNSRGATAVAAYSTRARPGAPVSAPLDWNELGPGLRPDAYTVENLRRRLAGLRSDPWSALPALRQSLPAA